MVSTTTKRASTLVVATLTAFLMLASSAQPAGAYAADVSGVGSTASWSTGGERNNSSNGDDVRLLINNGSKSQYVRWKSCTTGTVGTTRTVYANGAYVEIGRNFNAGCFRFQWKAISQNGTWTGRANYSANFFP